MADATPQKIIEQLKKRVYKPIYFLQGEEPFYIDEVVEYLSKSVLAPKERSLNLVTCHGKGRTLSELISQVRTFPMLGERKVIVVKNAQEMMDLQRRSGQESLLDYLKAPHEKNMLVFSYKYKKLSPQLALVKQIESKGVLLTTKKIYESQIPKWIEGYVQNLGYSITPEGSIALQGLVGNNLQQIARELKKVMINLKEGGAIDADRIMKHVGMHKEVNHFALQTALAAGSAKKTLSLLQLFLRQQKQGSLLILLGLLTTFFSKVLQVYQLRSQNNRALAQELQVHPYFVEQYVLASRAYDADQTISILHYLHEADLQVKGIHARSASERAILEELIAKVLLLRSTS